MSNYKTGNKPKNPVSYEKAIPILNKLLKGECPKRIAHEENVSLSAVSHVKNMFPLFFHFRKIK